MTSSPIAADRTTWTIDPAHTQVAFAVKHMMFTKVRGRFGKVSGAIAPDVDSTGASKVTVEIDAASLDTGVEDRDQHLRSEDFLHVEAHPEIRFESRRMEGDFSEAGDDFRLVGDLTIRGESREVVLDVTFEGVGTDPWGGRRAGFTASTTIDRREWGLTWNQALESGGILVGHDVEIELSVQAVEAQDG